MEKADMGRPPFGDDGGKFVSILAQFPFPFKKAQSSPAETGELQDCKKNLAFLREKPLIFSRLSGIM